MARRFHSTRTLAVCFDSIAISLTHILTVNSCRGCPLCIFVHIFVINHGIVILKTQNDVYQCDNSSVQNIWSFDKSSVTYSAKSEFNIIGNISLVLARTKLRMIS